MKIQVCIFFSVLFTFLDVIQASKDLHSGEHVVKPFFSQLFCSFFNCGAEEAVSRADFHKTKNLYQNFPLQTLEAVRSFESQEFFFFFFGLIRSKDFTKFSSLCTYVTRWDCSDDIYTSFENFSDSIVDIINFMLEGADFSECKKSILGILSILRRVSYSPEIFVRVSWFQSKKVLTTKTFLDSYTYFIENLEGADDSLIAFKNAYYRLKYLSHLHKGNLPSQEPLRSRIISYISECAYYKNVIYLKDLTSLDPKTADPGMLSYFLNLDEGGVSLRHLFYTCGLVDLETAKRILERECMGKLMDEYSKNRSFLYPKILERMGDRGQWFFKVYLKLFYGISVSQIADSSLKE